MFSKPLIVLQHVQVGGVDLLQPTAAQLQDLSFTLLTEQIVLFEASSPGELALLLDVLRGRSKPQGGIYEFDGRRILFAKSDVRALENLIVCLSYFPAMLEGHTVEQFLHLSCQGKGNDPQWLQTCPVWLQFFDLENQSKTPLASLQLGEQWAVGMISVFFSSARVIIVPKFPDYISRKRRQQAILAIKAWTELRGTAAIFVDATEVEGDLPPPYYLHHGTIINPTATSARMSENKINTGAAVSLDGTGRIEFISQEAARKFQFDPARQEGKTLQDLVWLSKDRQEAFDLIAALQDEFKQKRTAFEKTYQLYARGSGKDLYFWEIQAFVDHLADEIKQIDLLVIDRTEQHELERMKIDFSGIMAHELRTPLTGIEGNLSLLKFRLQGKLDDTDLQMIRSMEICTKRLQTLIENLLRIASDQTHAIELRFKNENFSEIVNTSLVPYNELVRAKRATLKLEIENAALPVLCDSVRIVETVENLLNNALQHVDENGTIRVAVAYQIKARKVQLTVTNTGKPISQESLPHLFTLFYRGNQDKKHIDMHLGLGLYIAKRIIESHGGDIWVSSSQEEGTTFGLWLPFEPPKYLLQK